MVRHLRRSGWRSILSFGVPGLLFLLLSGCIGRAGELSSDVTLVEPVAVRVSPSGRFALVTNGNFRRLGGGRGFVSTICTDPAAGVRFNKPGFLGDEVRMRFLLGDLAISPDERYAFVADRVGDALQILDLSGIAEAVCSPDPERNGTGGAERFTGSRQKEDLHAGTPPHLGTIRLNPTATTEESADVLPFAMTLSHDPRDPARTFLFVTGLETGEVFTVDLTTFDPERLDPTEALVRITDPDVAEDELAVQRFLRGTNAIVVLPEIERMFVSDFVLNQVFVGSIPSRREDGSYTLTGPEKTIGLSVGSIGRFGTTEARGMVAGETSTGAPRLYVALRVPGSVAVFDPLKVTDIPPLELLPLLRTSEARAEDAIIDILPAGTDPGGLALSGGRLYVANATSADLYVIDTETRRTVDIVPLETGAYTVEIAPGGRWIYVTNFLEPSISVVDATVNRVIQRIPDPEGLKIELCDRSRPIPERPEDCVVSEDYEIALVGGEVVQIPFRVTFLPQPDLTGEDTTQTGTLLEGVGYYGAPGDADLSPPLFQTIGFSELPDGSNEAIVIATLAFPPVSAPREGFMPVVAYERERSAVADAITFHWRLTPAQGDG
ncbi:MAG: hypothetical protein D6812_00425 [Deltaproteobacteria bacterium]|nr:MAG: hypothetical protein D6812_00425 [Deltaproteobacteria bacterium]